MTKTHWTCIVLMLLVGYMLGVWFPGPGVSLRSKFGV